MKNVLVVVAVLSLSVPLLSAQRRSEAPTDEWKIYGGFQYSSLDTHSVQDFLNLEHIINPSLFPQLDFGNRQNLNGLNAGIQEDIRPWFGVVVDVGSGFGEKRILLNSGGGVNTSTRTKMKFYTVTGGPQLTVHRGERFQPFIRALVGGGFHPQPH